MTGDVELLIGTVVDDSVAGQVTVDVAGVELVALVSTADRPITLRVGNRAVLVPYA